MTIKITSISLAALVAACGSIGLPAVEAPLQLDGGDAFDGRGRSTVKAHDISILFPELGSSDLSSLLRADSVGAEGELIPASVYSLIPQVRFNPVVVNSRTDTFVIGVRVNCDFAPQKPQERCHGQLQLSFQLTAGAAPLSPGVPVVLADASLHAIYSLTEAEFRQLVADLVALRQANGGVGDVALGVHPLLTSQSVQGAFAQGVRETVLKYAGERTLTKVTFITIETPLSEGSGVEGWKFGAFERRGTRFERTAISTLPISVDEQLVRSPLAQTEGNQFETTITPALPREGDLAALFGSGAESAQRALAENAYDLALQIENPLKRSPHDTDCASCHLTHARGRGEFVFGFNANSRESAFDSAGLTTTVPVVSPVNVRAFGYGLFSRSRQTSRASISRRVVNETAYTLRYLNQ